MFKLYEVKVAGYSLGFTKYNSEAETWFKKSNRDLPAQLIEINGLKKSVMLSRRGRGASIRDISGIQSLTQTY